MTHPDIIVVSDPRFAGGTASALIADVLAFRAMGASVGLLPVTSGFFAHSAETPNRQVFDLLDLDGVSLLRHDQVLCAETVFFHHPLTFFHGVAERTRIKAHQAVLVAHHPPFRGDGSLEYNPVTTNRRIVDAFGLRPMWAPVSGVIRRHLRSFAPLVRLTSDDWVNIFETPRWQSRRPVFEATTPEMRPTVGRHGRSDILKWPDSPEDVMASLGAGNPGWHTRVMGCPAPALSDAGADLSGWTILAFNDEPVDEFLDSLDVFSYFYSSRWVEAFGRAIIEAMLMQRPCVLDPRLRQTFGDLAEYCAPSEVPALLESLRRARETTCIRAAQVRQRVVAQYSAAAMAQRLTALQIDRGTTSRRGTIQAPPMATLRKTIGLARRRRAFAARQVWG